MPITAPAVRPAVRRPHRSAALATLLTALTVVGLVLPGPASAAGPLNCTPGSDAVAAFAGDSRCERWTVVHDTTPDPVERYQQPSAIATSPSGDLVVTAGYGAEDLGDTNGLARTRWRILGNDGETGAQRFLARPGPQDAYARPLDVALAADGTILSTGYASSAFGSSDADLIAVALDPADGATLFDVAIDAADVTPGGTDLRGWFVLEVDGGHLAIVATVGRGQAASRSQDLALLVLDRLTGTLLGATTVPNAVPAGVAYPVGAGVSSDGRTVVAGGTGAGPGEYNIDMVTFGIDVTDVTDPRASWVRRDDGRGHNSPDRADDLVVADDVAYIAGISSNDADGPPFAVDYDLLTTALDVTTGAVLWQQRAPYGAATPTVGGIAVGGSADSPVVAVAGRRTGGNGNAGFVTALDARTGAERFDVDIVAGADDRTAASAVVVTSKEVVVTGVTSSSASSIAIPQMRVGDSLTVGLDVTDGTRLWAARHNATDYGDDAGRQVVADATGRAFVLGRVTNNVENDRNFYDFKVLAY